MRLPDKVTLVVGVVIMLDIVTTGFRARIEMKKRLPRPWTAICKPGSTLQYKDELYVKSGDNKWLLAGGRDPNDTINDQMVSDCCADGGIIRTVV